MDLAGLIAEMLADRDFETVTTNPLAQFGMGNRRYIGAELLPERLVPENSYEEDEIKYRTVIANAGSRYSPVQVKGAGEMFGQMRVATGKSDIGREFTGRDYDGLTRLLRANGGNEPEMEAAARLIGYADTAINRALVEYNEVQRWQAIINAQVIRKGANKYREVVDYPNPANHRVAAGGDWTSDAVDPMDQILTIAEHASDNGYTINRIVTRRAVATTFARNLNTARRGFGTRIIPDGTGSYPEYKGLINLDFVNNMMAMEGLPMIELYDLTYNTQTGRYPFLPAGCMAFFCTTGRDIEIESELDPENIRVLEDTLGYTAIGTVAGASSPGRQINVLTPNDFPPRLMFEGVQESIPVVQDPDAIYVINSITTGS